MVKEMPTVTETLTYVFLLTAQLISSTYAAPTDNNNKAQQYIIRWDPKDTRSIQDVVKTMYTASGKDIFQGKVRLPAPIGQGKVIPLFTAEMTEAQMKVLREKTDHKKSIIAVERDIDLKFDLKPTKCQAGCKIKPNKLNKPGKAGKAGKPAKAMIVEQPGSHINIFKRNVKCPAPTGNKAPWGLHRISRKGIIPDTSCNDPGEKLYCANYEYTEDKAGNGGAGVDIYIVDSGIDMGHREFGGRAKKGFSGYGDDHGDSLQHGTHVAGIIGSKAYGVAKNANLISVKIIGKENSEASPEKISVTLKGLEWIIDQHKKRKSEKSFKGSVINMSLSYKEHEAPINAMKAILEIAVKEGIHIVAAAGNDGIDACAEFPGGLNVNQQLSSIFSVGASDIFDDVPDFSGRGKCVDLFAPGTEIFSTVPNGGSDLFCGTSMATPHVSGAIALELVKNPALKTDPRGMKKLLLSKTAKLEGDFIDLIDDTHTRILKV
ncbi:Cerevisin [Arthrobotrys entomopaga]|nr:Cerevisin [Arthrobotrys entomopaga]